MEGDPDDLEYLNTENAMTLVMDFRVVRFITVTVYAPSISIYYSVESGLLDQLWDAKPREESGKDYGEFIGSSDYNPHREMGPFRTLSPSDNPAAQHITSRPASCDVASDASFSIARTWMALCHDTHEECPKFRGVMPSRVIDVGTKRPITYVRLH